MIDSSIAFMADQKDSFTLNSASRNVLLGDLIRAAGLKSFPFSKTEIVTLNTNDVLYEQGNTIDYVYFPLNSVVSGLAIMEDGTTVETSMVGRDGVVGVSAIMGREISRQWIWVLISGDAVQVEAKLLDHLFVHNEDALKLLLGYYRSLVTQVSQRCVCNTRHTILERLCCWLLMLQDRVGGSNLRLTQEIIASRVGARRAGITVAAGILQEMGALEYHRGELHIRQRKVLENVVCECYGIMKADLM